MFRKLQFLLNNIALLTIYCPLKCISFKSRKIYVVRCWAVVVAQSAEWWLPLTEVCSLNPVIANIL